MARFKDSQEREWVVEIDPFVATAIRQDPEGDKQFLIGDADGGGRDTFSRLEGDPVRLCRVLYLLCEEQAKAAGLNQQQFYFDVLKHSIAEARVALLVAIVSFSQPQRGATLETFTADRKTLELENTINETFLSELGQQRDGIEDKLKTQLRNASKPADSSASRPEE